MQEWVDNIKTVQDENIKLAIIAANNHYIGFGPGTVNILGICCQIGMLLSDGKIKENDKKSNNSRTAFNILAFSRRL